MSEGSLYRLRRGFHVAYPVQVRDGLEADHGFTHLESMTDLGEGPGAAGDSNEHIGGVDDDDVASLTHIGGHGHADIGVGVLGGRAGENAQSEAAFCGGASSRSLHHSAETAADEDGAATGDLAAHIECKLVQGQVTFPGSDDPDDGRPAPHGILEPTL
jgi:hypothetical protein